MYTWKCLSLLILCSSRGTSLSFKYRVESKVVGSRPIGVHLLCLSLGNPYGGPRQLWEVFFFFFCLFVCLCVCVCVFFLGGGDYMWCCSGPPLDEAFELWIRYSRCLGFNGYYQRRFLIFHVGGGVGDLIQMLVLLLYVWCGL